MFEKFSSIQSVSHVQIFETPWTATRQASLSIANSQSLLNLMSIELVRPSNHIILCCPLLLPPSIFSSIRVFSNKSVLHIRWPKYLELQPSASVLPMNIQEWFLLELTDFTPCSPRGSLESFPTPQFKSINSLVLSFLYGPALTSIHDYWKSHSFDRQTFVDKVMSLLFNMLSRLTIDFLPRSKCLLLSWLQSPSAMILKPKKIKIITK